MDLKLVGKKNKIIKELKKEYKDYEWECENIEIAILYTLNKYPKKKQ
ncbi:hypothetical protein LCGC14_2965350 [marine sediment metagenome]|uniref:Uncharacterized protein n=1 Tax=marine sediment metagenome TaxID=412755 RepID=A0A0F8XBV5_9ZZZZ